MILVALFSNSCGKETPSESPAAEAPTFVYVATGTAYAGDGITQSTPSKLISKFTSEGKFVVKLRDYNDGSGDTPVALLDHDDDYLLALIENTGGRRIVKVPKDGSGTEQNVLVSAAAFTAVVRHFARTPDLGFLISITSGLEKFTSSNSRVTLSGSSYVLNPQGTCASASTLVPDFAILPSGLILMANASGTLQLDLIPASGYASVADCLATRTTPSVSHYPTSVLYHSVSQRIFVSYSNAVGPIHQIYRYDVSNNQIDAGNLAYNNSSVLQSVTAFAEMPDGTILAASGGFNTIERLTYTGADGSLVRAVDASFLTSSIETIGISSIVTGK